MNQGEPPSAGLSGARILIVEDEYYLADDLAKTLEREGAKVIGPAASLEEADALIAASEVDCAILDINLRGEMAFPVADRLESEGIPFVVASGYTSAAIPARFGQFRRIEKPFRPQEVLEIIPEMLAKIR